MVVGADVLTENYRRGTLEKLGLGYDVLSTLNPGLIYCAVSGYGRDGPWADKGGFDLIAQGFAGLMSITGEPGRPPAKTGNSVADINGGILAAVGILAAYVHKLKTGRGQMVDTSLMEAALQQTYWHAAIFFATGVSPQALGSSHVLTAPYRAFRTADGYINIGGANQGELGTHRRCARAPGVEERFALRHQRRADAPFARTGRGDGGGAGRPRPRALDRGVRRCRCAGGAGEFDRRSAVASAGAGARHGGRTAAPAGRGDEGARLPAAPVRDAGADRPAGAAAGRTHARSAARVRLRRCADRRAGRGRRGRGGPAGP